MKKIKIIGYGTYLPSNKIRFGDQIRYRINDNETQIDMSVKACIKALNVAKLDISEIDL